MYKLENIKLPRKQDNPTMACWIGQENESRCKRCGVVKNMIIVSIISIPRCKCA